VIGVIMCLTAEPIASINAAMMDFLSNLQNSNPIILGIVIGSIAGYAGGTEPPNWRQQERPLLDKATQEMRRELTSRLRERQPYEVPKHQGVCIPDGFFHRLRGCSDITCSRGTRSRYLWPLNSTSTSSCRCPPPL